MVLKKINEKGNYLNYVGSGYSISMDFPINNKFDLLKHFLNEIVRVNKLKVNFAKDFITDESNAHNYKECKMMFGVAFNDYIIMIYYVHLKLCPL